MNLPFSLFRSLLLGCLFWYFVCFVNGEKFPHYMRQKLQIQDEEVVIPEATPTGPFLNVHIIAHTHDDVGWLKTVDEYFYGANQTIQDAGVQYILDTVIRALERNPERRFIYVEIAFFVRWWNEQTEETKQIVRNLVTSKRLEFINGGWCMNDEANTHYTAIVEQMTYGHWFLFNEFGIRPTIGWHIDPFGHASTQASLFAQMGFDAFFFGRIDWQDHNVRNESKELEFIWRGSQSLGEESDIFSHVLYTDYCYIHGFSFEGGDPPIQDDTRLFDVNIKERADLFAEKIRHRSISYRTNNIMAPFGCDFQYQNAEINFKNMDKLIAYINSHSEYNMKLFYSTPSIYIDAVHRDELEWSLNEYDFFPYADNAHSYWSGYFTSRPALKGYVRTRNNLLSATDKLYTTALNRVDKTLLEKRDTLSDAFGIAQHHDAVAGTEKQHVADDYAKRLSIGSAQSEDVINFILGETVSKRSPKPTFEFCPYLNVSICPPLKELEQGRVVPIVIYNPLAWSRTHFVRLPVVHSSGYKVTNNIGVATQVDIVPNEDLDDHWDLLFSVDLPPMGFTTYFVEQTNKSSIQPVQKKEAEANPSIENEYLKITFSTSNGHIASIVDKTTNQEIQVDQEFLWYNGSTGNNELSSQASGAYIFRPNQSEPFTFPGKVQLHVVDGQLVKEVYQTWNSWVSQVTRLFKGRSHIEIEANVGPIDISDGLGKEVITRYNTNLKTKNIFYTDSEGQEMQQRIKDQRPTWNYNVTEPVAGNYYPMNIAAFIKDETVDKQLTFITDRSHGCSSMKEGSFEQMLHRRLLKDDGRGVGEPLNETEGIRTYQIVFPSKPAASARVFRPLSLLHNFQPILAFSSSESTAKWMQDHVTSFKPLKEALPSNVHLLTLKTFDDGQVLLRLNHIFATGEDSDLSKPVTVDLDNLFVNLKVVSIQEMTLSANRPKSELNRLKWNIKNHKSVLKDESKQKSVQDHKIELKPMEIRTFLVRLQQQSILISI